MPETGTGHARDGYMPDITESGTSNDAVAPVMTPWYQIPAWHQIPAWNQIPVWNQHNPDMNLGR